MNSFFEKVFGTVKEKMISLKEKVQDFISDNPMRALLCAILIAVILLSLILIMALSGSEKQKKQAAQKLYQRPVTLSEELLIPPSPAVKGNYQASRTTKENWTPEDVEPWWTNPGEKEIQDLSRANNKMINEIIEAAP